jgi:hypothetical protein
MRRERAYPGSRHSSASIAKKEFTDSVSRKLLAYALNRSLQLSDESLIEGMEARLAANDYRFDSLVEAIVTSPQFLNRRVPDPIETSKVERTNEKDVR